MKERGFAILATMFAVTSLDLDDEGKRELARKVHADLGKIITYTTVSYTHMTLPTKLEVVLWGVAGCL